jgi:hypothetical protein
MLPLLLPWKVIALPAAGPDAATAWAGEALYVWLNRSGATTALRIDAEGVVIPLAPPPFLVTDVAACPEGFLATGSRAGTPVVGMLTTDGAVRWTADLPVGPARWPVPACGGSPRVAWQPKPEEVRVVRLEGGAIAEERSLVVRGAVRIGRAGEDLVAAWHDGDTLRLARPGQEGVASVPAPRGTDAAIGMDGEHVLAAWTDATGTWWQRFDAALNALGPVARVPSEGAQGGLIAMAPGPLFWLQRRDRDGTWTAVISGTDGTAFALDGHVSAVTTWGGVVAVVRERAVELYRRSGAG